MSAFKVLRRGYLSSFCHVHALIDGAINHIAVVHIHGTTRASTRSRRYALLLYAPLNASASADARWINCVSRRHGDYNISVLAQPAPGDILAANARVRRIINLIRWHAARAMIASSSYRAPPSPFSLRHEKLRQPIGAATCFSPRVQRDPSAGKSIHFRIKAR